jgi:hypothetical protein
VTRLAAAYLPDRIGHPRLPLGEPLRAAGESCCLALRADLARLREIIVGWLRDRWNQGVQPWGLLLR